MMAHGLRLQKTRPAARAGGLALALGLAWGQGAAWAAEPQAVRELSYEGKRHTLVLAIAGEVSVSTRTLRAPLRMVVDLAGASWTQPRRELVIQDAMIRRARIAQYQLSPPVVRLVIEPNTRGEPTVAIQQTGQRVYVTVAGQPGPVVAQPPAAPTPAPRTAPSARPAVRPRATPAAPSLTPARLWLRTRLTPEGWTAPEASPSPRPTAAPAVRPPRPTAPPATPAPPLSGGEGESLPGQAGGGVSP